MYISVWVPCDRHRGVIVTTNKQPCTSSNQRTQTGLVPVPLSLLYVHSSTQTNVSRDMRWYDGTIRRGYTPCRPSTACSAACRTPASGSFRPFMHMACSCGSLREKLSGPLSATSCTPTHCLISYMYWLISYMYSPPLTA